MKHLKRILFVLCACSIVGLFSLTQTGCTPRMAGHLAGAALLTGAVVGTAAVVAAAHEAHFHHYNCGCPRSWHNGHWVYYYQGGWEYYDAQGGVWYRFED